MAKKVHSKSCRDTSWRSIEQDVRGRNVTPNANKKRKKFYWRALAITAGLVALGTAALIFYRKDERGVAIHGVTQTLSEITVISDGVLDRNWVTSYLDFYTNTPLMAIDLNEVKRKLEKFGQIRHAIVTRQFPGTLIIKIEERVPIFKMAVQRQNGQPTLLFVDADGIVYRGVNYSKILMRKLPFLCGIKLKQQDKNFEKLSIEKVVSLLNLTKQNKPHLFKDWKVIDCTRFDPTPEALWSLIRVDTHTSGSILFGSKDFLEQLERLDKILQHAQQHKLTPIQQIDLSTENPTLNVDPRRVLPQ